MTQLSRRSLVRSLGLASLSAALPSWTRIAFAKAPTDKRLVLVILRGGLDGLAIAPPYGDAAYRSARGELTIDDVRKLDGTFALNPAMAGFETFWKKRQLALIHAVASPYRERSHFDAQSVLECGTGRALGDTGWLNRALKPLQLADATQALAIAQTVPLVLRGDQQVSSWMPNVLPEVSQDYLSRVLALYQRDPVLHAALSQGMNVRDMAAGSAPDKEQMKDARGVANLVPLARTAGELIAKPNGPRIAVLEATGWDTHARQGTDDGLLTYHLTNLDRAMSEFAAATGPVWSKTAVVIVTEFGRTVAPNGSGGTDHGMASAAFVLGGAVKGGQVIADWPGLSQSALYEGRDLKPTTDMRAIFKAALISHLGLDDAAVESIVLPDARGVAPLTKLFV